MQLSLIVYVSDMERSVSFFESLGFGRHGGEIDTHWNEFHVGDAVLALHLADPGDIPPASSHLSLNINVEAGELDRLYAICEKQDYPIGAPIQDIGFGRFFWIIDPDGLPVQFNERAT